MFIPTRGQRKMVQVLHAHGIPYHVIARNIMDDEHPKGIDQRTLKRAFRDELAGAYDQVKAGMIASLVKQGLAGNVNAIKYWLATRGGPDWRISEMREVSGRLELTEAPIEELERELATLRARTALADRTRDMAPNLPDPPDGVLH